jgi:hypothetical protein
LCRNTTAISSTPKNPPKEPPTAAPTSTTYPEEVAGVDGGVYAVMLVDRLEGGSQTAEANKEAASARFPAVGDDALKAVPMEAIKVAGCSRR